jgi:hypothetical protein
VSAGASEATPAPSAIRTPGWRAIGVFLGLAAAWYFLYVNLLPIAQSLTYGLMRLPRGAHLSSSIEFFIYEVPKVLMLLVIVVFGVGIVRTFFTPERTRQLLAGKRESVGNVLASVLGIVTPFCSCSACPLFIGFVESGVPLGVTFSFLVAAPMINEVALVLLFGMFGLKVAAIYVTTGLAIAITAGLIIGRLHMERFVEPWVYEVKVAGEGVDERLTWPERISAGRQAIHDIVGKVWLYVIAGIAVGAAIHGYVPVGVLSGVMGKGAWWSVPGAVLLGVPLYSNAAGVIPIMQALLEKGASLGTALAFVMAVIAISPPEMVILRKVLKPQLIATFIGIVTVGIVIVGFLFNAIL